MTTTNRVAALVARSDINLDHPLPNLKGKNVVTYRPRGNHPAPPTKVHHDLHGHDQTTHEGQNK